ncbi:MAG: thiol-activated cytolysin family protein [Melioribacteraceae bacterium]|nr:thiol-activated cytolysin family protein [Melioribacteraceae bacterium]
MKHLTQISKKIILLCLILALSSCTEDSPTGIDPEKEAANIQEHILKLSYNPEQMLNYQQTGGEELLKEIVEDTSETVSDGNYTTVCKSTTYNLKKNFDKVAILRPTNGIVWPGALVKGNQSLMDGIPEPIGIERSPVTISVNLPGMGENGVRTVENPKVSSVQAAIDSSLEWWNNNAYEEGYVNAANSSFHLSSSYSSKQLSLELDLNSEWASGSVSSQFDYFSNEEKKVVMAVFKQAFYDVRFDTPTSPDEVFEKGVTLNKVEGVINDAAAPAYIKSVTYGRIIMFRMESSSSYKSADLEAAFEYAAGYSFDSDMKSTYDEILEKSTIDLVTIGGNAAVATEPISADLNNANSILERIQGIISGENAVYSKNNPGVPIAYSVFYLKDNSLAKLGYTTEYTATECVTTQKSNTIQVYLGNFKAIKDCDGVGKGAGDFKIRIQILNENNGRIVKDYPDNGKYKNLSLSSGDAYLINKTRSFTIPKNEGKKFTVKLICYEKDEELIGDDYDNRMNGKTATGVFKFTNGNWSPPASNYSLSIGDGGCQVRLDYSVTIL